MWMNLWCDKRKMDAVTSWSRCDDSNKWGIFYRRREGTDGPGLAVHLTTPLSRVGVCMPAVHVGRFGDSVCKRRQGGVVVIRLPVVVVVV